MPLHHARRTKRPGRKFQVLTSPPPFFFFPHGESDISPPSWFWISVFFNFSFGVKRLFPLSLFFKHPALFLSFTNARCQSAMAIFGVALERAQGDAASFTSSPGGRCEKSAAGSRRDENDPLRPRHTNPPIFRFKTRPRRLRKP